ncbi:MAG: DUF4093 domain-containing protein [Clostridia bacterium]|nr:DUF4093 domain-containing protein [Clostridia bacterium]
MLKIKEIIIVEGSYDKSKLSSLTDATIVVTDGFLIFKDKKKCDMIRALAQKNGAIIFTDSDSAGFKIRNYLKNILSGCRVRHAYIPDIKGKEKRKNHHSKEGFLGVEGVSDEIIIKALENAGFESCTDVESKRITKTDFFSDGLTGANDSADRRERLKRKLNLPKHLSANMLLEVLNRLYGYDEYKKIINELFKNKKM